MAVIINLMNKTKLETPKFAEKIHNALKGCKGYVDSDILLNYGADPDRPNRVILLLNGHKSDGSVADQDPDIAFNVDVTDETVFDNSEDAVKALGIEFDRKE